MSAVEKEIAAIKYFAERYDIIAQYPFVAERPIRLYDHDPKDADSRRCRFCGRGKPDVTFKKVAHAVPEFLGNKAIRSMNECDVCNEFFADSYEDHLSKWSLFARSISQVWGKEGKPTYKNPSKTVRIETGETGLNIHLTDPSVKSVPLQEGGPQQFALPTDGKSPPYVPIRAAKALLKIACSLCPRHELAQCGRAIDWLMGRNNIGLCQFLVFYGFTPGPIGDAASQVILLRRKGDTAEPYLWLVVQCTGHRFQIFVPACPADDELFGKAKVKFPAYHYRTPSFGLKWPYGETTYRLLDWSGTEPVQTTASATFHVENAIRHAPPGSTG